MKRTLIWTFLTVLVVDLPSTAMAVRGAEVPTAAAGVRAKPTRSEIAAAVARDFGITPAEVEQEPWCKILEQDNWYHQSRVMEWPAFDRSSTRTVAPHGGSGDFICRGVNDDIVIQQAIDSLPATGGKVVVLPGVYSLGTCIRPRDHTELEIQGTLKVADAVTSLLTTDVRSGDRTAQVADASKFRVGMWVTFMDDDPNKVHKGGRNYGESVLITGISGNTITVGDALARKWANSSIGLRFDSYQVARRGYVTTSHSAILALKNNRVYIHGGNGRGAIDGYRTAQSPTAPLTCTGPKEDLRANCGVSICESSWIKVEGLDIHDANLPNVAVYQSEHCEITGVRAARCNDKNICVLLGNKVRIVDNDCHDAQVEDGISCHGPVGPYMLIACNRTTGNPRFGIGVGIKADYAIVARNNMHSNKIDMAVVGVPPYEKERNRWKQDNLGLIAIENTTGKPQNPTAK
jgi:hypothetical protein